MLNLVAAAVFVLVCCNLGRAVLRLFAGEDGPSAGERFLLGFGLGAALFGLLAFVLGTIGWFRPAGFAALIGLAALAGVSEWPRTLPGLAGLFRAPRDRGAAVLFWSGMVVPLAVALAFGLCPPFAKDALVYHLTAPKLYLAAGGFRYVPGNIYANFPAGIEMLFALGLAFGLEQFPALVHGTFFLFTVLGLRALGQRLTGPVPAALLALVFAATPSAFIAAGWPYVDLAVAYAVTCFLISLFAYADTGRRGLLVVAGTFAGLAFTAKYTGGLLAPLGGVVLLMWARRNGQGARRALGDLALFLIPAAILALPWLAKNLVLTGNPVYPFLFGIFGGRDWDAFRADTFATFLRAFGRGRSLVDYLLLPVNLAFRARWERPEFDGQIGILYLALLPLFLALLARRPWRRPAAGTLLFLLAAWFIFWTQATQQVRFLFPVLVLFLVALAAMLPEIRFDSRGRRAAAWALAAVTVISGLAYAAPVLARVDPFPYLVGRESRVAFLARGIKEWAILEYIRDRLPPDAKLLLLQAGNRGYYIERAYYSDSVVEVDYLDRQVRRAGTAEGLRDLLLADGFTHILVNEAFILRPFQGRSLETVKMFLAGYCDPLARAKPYMLVAIRTGAPRATTGPSRSDTGSGGAGP